MGGVGLPPPAYNGGSYQQANNRAQNSARWSKGIQAKIKTPSMSSEPLWAGRPIWMWIAWAGFIGYVPSANTKGIGDMAVELDKLTAEHSEKWAAFVAAQRINGGDIWDTGPT